MIEYLILGKQKNKTKRQNSGGVISSMAARGGDTNIVATSANIIVCTWNAVLMFS